MEESDIKRQHLETVQWVCMSLLICNFRLLNEGLSFCHLMEQCLRDQQFVALLLYIDDICIFAPTINNVLD